MLNKQIRAAQTNEVCAHRASDSVPNFFVNKTHKYK